MLCEHGYDTTLDSCYVCVPIGFNGYEELDYSWQEDEGYDPEFWDMIEAEYDYEALVMEEFEPTVEEIETFD